MGDLTVGQSAADDVYISGLVAVSGVNFLGSFAITTNPVPVSGNSVSLVLTTGSMVFVALAANTWTFTNAITNTRAWAVSVSGNNAYDLSIKSGQTMLFHSLPMNTIWSEETAPTLIAVRAAVATSGTIEFWAP